GSRRRAAAARRRPRCRTAHRADRLQRRATSGKHLRTGDRRAWHLKEETMRRIRSAAFIGAAVLLVTGCSAGGGGGGGAENAGSGTGGIKVWLSNNEQELAWGKAVVDAWNEEHPDQKVTSQEIPAASSSEEAITAAITAGTAPCLVFNIAPAAVSGWVRQGGLVDLSSIDGADDYISERGGDVDSYQTDGKFYQLPWKSNPVMVMYNKELFTKAGLNADDPKMNTYDAFLQ